VDLLKLDVEGVETEVLLELRDSGALEKVSEIIAEYHHHLRNDDDRLSEFLGLLEDASFGYQVTHIDLAERGLGAVQTMIVHAYRKPAAGR
jgi:hypothetical protein